MKSFFGVIILFSTLSVCGQVRRTMPFVELGTYLYSGFSQSMFVQVSGGLSYKINKHISPEASFGFMLSGVPDSDKHDMNGNVTELTLRNGFAKNINISPKITFGNEEDDDVLFYVLPIYTFSNFEAEEIHYVNNLVNPNQTTRTLTKVKNVQHSFGIGIGLLVGFSEDSDDKFNLTLYLNRVDLGTALNMLPHSTDKHNTKNTLGLGLKYYIGFRKKVKAKL